jgi:predicted LPLAT superfamily acyltransferase
VDEAAEMNHGGRVPELPDAAPTPVGPTGLEAREAWLARRERGSRVGIRVLLLLTRILGRRGGRALLRPIIFYFTLFAGDARRASRAWYERVTGASSFWTAYRHLLRFAEVALDRVFFVRGELDHFEFDREGTQLLRDAVASGQGALLLGAHFGSFEAMRAASRAHSLPINILAHNDNARMIAAFLDEVSGGQSRVRVIEIDPIDKTYILEVKQRIDEGELVAVLGDRLGLNDRFTTVEFFGAPARFPSGPYVMASALRCPVLMVFSTFVAPRRYVLRCELLADRVELPRASREQAIAGYAGQFASRLEHYARAAPDNWFNFFDFWFDFASHSPKMQADEQRPH